MVFSLRIKDERLKRKMSQKEFGAFLGVSGTMVMKYESGEKNPSIKRLISFTSKLQKDANYLLGLEYASKLDNTDYIFRLSKNEIQVISELRKRTKMYHKLLEDPKRTIDFFELKFNKSNM